MLDQLLTPFQTPTSFKSHRIRGLRPKPVRPNETMVLANIKSPGCIRHLFISMAPRALRDIVLRFYWDGEKDPSIECPVNDFFGIGHDLPTAGLSSLLFYVAPNYGYNCYIPMPFGRSGRITLTNEGQSELYGLYYHISYHTYDAPDIPYRLHAVWRRVFPAYRRGANFNLLEAKGAGRILGVIYHVCRRDTDDRWTHGGGDQIFIDGDTADPSYIGGTGGEEFAHHAWGLYPGAGPYAGAHLVHPLPSVKRAEGPMPFEPHGWEQHEGGRYSMYRYFIPDPIYFKSSVRMTFGTAANEISATTYWYQGEPHVPFSRLPSTSKRLFCSRLKEEETYKPIDLGTVPTAVLGPMMVGDLRRVWSPSKGVDLKREYKTGVRQPFGDVVRPPYLVRWRRSSFRGGFIDLGAIHRPKCALRARGLWNFRSIHADILSHQLIRLKTIRPRRVKIRVGYEDRLWVWLRGKSVAKLDCPLPENWLTSDVTLDLEAGWQDLVITRFQDRPPHHLFAWPVYLKFLELDDTPATNLSFDPFKSLDPTPERYVEPWPPEEPIKGFEPADASGEGTWEGWRDPAMLA